jgi:hypothetical protein
MLALFTGLRASWRRGQKLRRLSRVLGNPSFDVESLLNSASKSAEEELYDLIEGDPTLRVIMEKHHTTRADLKAVYGTLLACGAGQWARGHWVAASALCYGFTLEFVLNEIERFEKRSDAQLAAFRLVGYFRTGKVGRV